MLSLSRRLSRPRGLLMRPGIAGPLTGEPRLVRAHHHATLFPFLVLVYTPKGNSLLRKHPWQKRNYDSAQLWRRLLQPWDYPTLASKENKLRASVFPLTSETLVLEGQGGRDGTASSFLLISFTAGYWQRAHLKPCPAHPPSTIHLSTPLFIHLPSPQWLP